MKLSEISLEILSGKIGVVLIPDKIVSVRMPVSLVSELRDIAQDNHYLDVSEAIRSMLRRKWLEQREPGKAKLMEIKQSLSGITDPEQLRALKKTIRLLEDLNEL